MEYTKLFSPITIRNMSLKNRIVMPPLHHLYTPEGYATPRFNEYYWRRAEGGIGLIIVGGCRFDDFGGAWSMMSLQSDEFIPGYKEFTDGMHERGAKVGVQLYHAGAYAMRASIPGGQSALAPSEVFSRFTHEMPREMTIEDIDKVISDWAAGARRAKEAGFDLVEILASAGYLICQFLSPLKNLRTDEYGGSWENRTRFARRVVAAVREAVGPDYPICMRIAGNDFVPGSNGNDEAVAFCRLMEEQGVDMLNVTGGWHETVIPQLTAEVPDAGFSYLVQAIRDAVSIPVALSNRVNDPYTAEKMLQLENADLICVGRPMITDPDWAKKAQEGRSREIRKCLACNQGCLSKTFFGKPIECILNPEAGHEWEKKPVTATGSKSFLVIGAGPAGCEFALRAAQLGNRVMVWEKGPAIGGQVNLAAVPPGKSSFRSLIEYYEYMLDLYNVQILYNTEVSEEMIFEENYDAVIVATGMTPKEISIPSVCRVPVVTAYDILKKEVIAGRNVLVLGGGSVGCETAEYLAQDASLSAEQIKFLLQHRAESVEKVLELMDLSRRNISVVDIAKIGAGFEPGTSWPVMKDLRRLHVKLYANAVIGEWKEKSVVISFKKGKDAEPVTKEIPFDMIVTAVGAVPENRLYSALREKGIASYLIGDASEIGKIQNAVSAGRALAQSLG